MGILSSLFTGVSGLNANGNALSVMGNNIANLSTVGFKSSRSVVRRLDQFFAGRGGRCDSDRFGCITQRSAGELQSRVSSVPPATHWIWRSTATAFSSSGIRAGAAFYSRAGQFHLDAQNRIVDPSGFFLQGYQVNTSGLITASIGGVTLPTTTAPPNPTSTVDIGANLNSQSTTGTFSLADPARDITVFNIAHRL